MGFIVSHKQYLSCAIHFFPSSPIDISTNSHKTKSQTHTKLFCSKALGRKNYNNENYTHVIFCPAHRGEAKKSEGGVYANCN